MAGQTARAARIGFGQGFDVGARLRKQRFDESLSLRASARADRELRLRESQLQAQQQKFNNRLLSSTDVSRFQTNFQELLFAAGNNLTPEEGGVIPFSTVREITDLATQSIRGNVPLGTQEKSQLDSIVRSFEQTGLGDFSLERPAQNTPFAEIEAQAREFEVQSQGTSRAPTTAPSTAFEDFGDDATQLSVGDLERIIELDTVIGARDRNIAFPSKPRTRTISPPNPRQTQAVRGGSFR